MLGNVLLLCFFVFFIFGIVGVQLWKGLLRNRCFLQLNTTSIPDHPLFEYVEVAINIEFIDFFFFKGLSITSFLYSI